MKWSGHYRLALLSIVIGALAPFLAEAFLWLLAEAQALLIVGIGHHGGTEPGGFGLVSPIHWNWWIPLATTTGGLLSGILVYGLAPEAEGHGTDAMIRAYHQKFGHIRSRVPLVKAVASAVTIGSGGAAGREGPVVQIAGGAASIVGRVLRLSDEERRHLMLIATAAGLAAIFKSPLGSALFAVSVLYSGIVYESAVLGFAILAAATSYAVAGLFEGWTPLFHLEQGLAFEVPSELLWYALIGVAAGAVGAALPPLFYGVRDAFRRLAIPRFLKPALGGLLLGALALLVPRALGGGYDTMQAAIDGRLAFSALLILGVAKMIALSLTVGSGGSGGVFAPTLFVGAMLGGAFSTCLCPLFSASPDPAALTVVGMAAMFAGTARVPLPALMMVVEMTGGYGLVVPAMIAVILSTVVQELLSARLRYQTLYEAQVAEPADSSVHEGEYCRSMYRLLRRGEMHLPEDMVIQEEIELLRSGQALALPDGRESLIMLRVEHGSQAQGKSLAELDLPAGTSAISVLRGDRFLIADRNFRFGAGDKVTLVALVDALDPVRASFGVPPKL